MLHLFNLHNNIKEFIITKFSFKQIAFHFTEYLFYINTIIVLFEKKFSSQNHQESQELNHLKYIA